MSDTVHMPKEMADAILDVMKEFGSLKKTGFNTHGKFHFAPVDDYYDKAAKLFPEKGLIILSSEVESDLVPMTTRGWDKDAKAVIEKATVWAVTKWRFKLCHNGFTYDDGLFRFASVPTSGPHTEGIAQSYVSKNFMRDLFKIATGEYELDDMPPEPHGVPDEPVAKASPAKVKPILDQIVDAIGVPANESETAKALYARITGDGIDGSMIGALGKEINDTVKGKGRNEVLHAALDIRLHVFNAGKEANLDACQPLLDIIKKTSLDTSGLEKIIVVKRAELKAASMTSSMRDIGEDSRLSDGRANT